MKLSLGFSPCPNDTFIFDALVNNKIDTEGFAFETVLEDVQTLNEWAKEGKLDISKISYGVLPLVLEQYVVLNSGGALGKGVGPLLITNQSTLNKLQTTNHKLQTATIAIPGINTTANLLFSFAFPEAKNKQFMLFHEIEDAVINGIVDVGVIIHENRFTYQQKGLKKILDLGSYWEEMMKVPIPLGGIVIKRQFDIDLQQQINKLINKSVEYAFENYPHLSDYVKKNAQEMSEPVIRQHIDLYVNNFSIDVGVEGKIAVNKLLELSHKINATPLPDNTSVFIS